MQPMRRSLPTALKAKKTPPTERFDQLDVQRQTLLQPDSPVYVYCSRRSIERTSGAILAQVRMVNCSAYEVQTVFLQIEGLNAGGEVQYTLRELPITRCAAAPHQVFGETQLLMLDRTPVSSLRITVERVVFADGLLWRKLPEHTLIEEADSDWKRCSCGMMHPPEQERCILCGAELLPAQEEVPEAPTAAPTEAPTEIPTAAPMEAPTEAPTEEPLQFCINMQEEYLPLAEPGGQLSPYMPPISYGGQTPYGWTSPFEPPAPVVRERLPLLELTKEEDEEDASNWQRILLYIFGTLAVLAAIAFLVFCLLHYTIYNS